MPYASALHRPRGGSQDVHQWATTGNAAVAPHVRRLMTTIFIGAALGTSLPCLFLWLADQGDRLSARRTA